MYRGTDEEERGEEGREKLTEKSKHGMQEENWGKTEISCEMKGVRGSFRLLSAELHHHPCCLPPPFITISCISSIIIINTADQSRCSSSTYTYLLINRQRVKERTERSKLHPPPPSPPPPLTHTICTQL